MTTYNYIDPTLSVSALPATYVPSGTMISVSAAQSAGTTLTATNASTYVLVGNCSLNATADVLTGYFTGAGNITLIPVGFAPVRVTVINWTDGITWDWMRGAPATNVIKDTTAADITVDTTTAIAVTADAAGGLGDVNYVTLTAALAASAKVLSFRIEA